MIGAQEGAAADAGSQQAQEGQEYQLGGQDTEINEQEIYRANLVACILLHRHEFSAHNEDLEKILKDKTNARDIYNKLVGEYMYNCFGQIQYHESKQVVLFHSKSPNCLSTKNLDHGRTPKERIQRSEVHTYHQVRLREIQKGRRRSYSQR